MPYCKDCTAWKTGIKHVKKELGECRRHAPQAIALPQGSRAEAGWVPGSHVLTKVVQFPIVSFDDWCLEGVEKPGSPTAA